MAQEYEVVRGSICLIDGRVLNSGEIFNDDEVRNGGQRYVDGGLARKREAPKTKTRMVSKAPVKKGRKRAK